jgi:predicted transcriptional regulator
MSYCHEFDDNAVAARIEQIVEPGNEQKPISELISMRPYGAPDDQQNLLKFDLKITFTLTRDVILRLTSKHLNIINHFTNV